MLDVDVATEIRKEWRTGLTNGPCRTNTVGTVGVEEADVLGQESVAVAGQSRLDELGGSGGGLGGAFCGQDRLNVSLKC